MYKIITVTMYRKECSYNSSYDYNHIFYCSHLGNLDSAYYEDVLTTLSNMYGDHSPDVARALHSIGGSLTPYKEYDQSE